MEIKKVETLEEAKYCNQLLTKLVHSEYEFSPNLNLDFVVDKWFEDIYEQPGQVIFIAKEDNKIVGYIYCKIISVLNGPTKELEALIDGLYVEKEYRNKGIAMELYNNVKNWLIEKDVKFVKLEVLSKNEPALHMYSNLGFEELSKVMVINLEN